MARSSSACCCGTGVASGTCGTWSTSRRGRPKTRAMRVADLTTLQAERTRYRNRIHSLLALHGVARLRLDERLPERLAAARDWAGAPLPPGVQARVLETWRLLQAVETRATARAAPRSGSTVRADDGGADGGPAAGPTARDRRAQRDDPGRRAASVAALRNRREVGALTGLVSAPYRSGTHRAGPGDCAEWAAGGPARRGARSRGPGSGINRPVRSPSGITAALAAAGP